MGHAVFGKLLLFKSFKLIKLDYSIIRLLAGWLQSWRPIVNCVKFVGSSYSWLDGSFRQAWKPKADPTINAPSKVHRAKVYQSQMLIIFRRNIWI